MNEKEKLIKQCRYYKGGTPQSLFSRYEQKWVEEMIAGDSFLIKNSVDEYDAYAVDDVLNDSTTPKSLKAMLFNRYTHFNGIHLDEFKEWYLSDYLGGLAGD